VLAHAHEHEILSQQLVYTAVTRAKENVLIIGSDDILNYASSRGVMKATGIENRFKEAHEH
jgi:ATP-dependent exoDNAse (exonuclease V) alpha subunit